MNQGEIVYKGQTKEGKEVVIRYPKAEDLHNLWEYINKLSKEKTFIRFQGEEILIEDEEKYLEDMLKNINEEKGIYLLIESEGKIVGVSDLKLADRVEIHVGLLGISIDQDYRGQGLGKLLMEKMIEEGEKKLSEMKVITLSCFASNIIAIHLYKSLGFQEFGKLPKGLQYKGEFIDHIYMYKEIK